MNVLIVDDMAENLLLLQVMLEGAGYAVVSAGNGREALDRLQTETISFIVSDVLMPVMDGFQLCRECKTHPEWRKIPFVFYTATYTEKRDEEFARSLGADAYIVKPQEPEVFLKIIAEVVGRPSPKRAPSLQEADLDELTYLAEHNKRLVAKLERKMAELEETNRFLLASEKQYRLLAENAQDVIFVLDPDLKYTYVSPSVKRLRGYEPVEVIGKPAAATLTPASWKLAAKITAEEMEQERAGIADPRRSLNIELEMRRKDGSTVWTEVKISLIRDESNRLAGILGVTRDISRRKQADKMLAETYEKLRAALGAVINTLVVTLEVRDPYTAGHQKRVADLARAIGVEMGMEGEKLEGLWMAGTIHDIGKIAVPAEILSKTSRLSPAEMTMVREHSRAGRDILKDVEFPWPIAEIIHQHHERLDGSGYPRGLKGNEIHLNARIIAVADTLEAMATHRPYRPALGIDVALAEIASGQGVIYDSEVAAACITLFKEKGYALAS